MADWTGRVKTGAKRALELLGNVIEEAIRAGNRRQVVVRDKNAQVLFQVSLTLVVLVGLAVFILAGRFLPLIIIALVVAYFLGYRAAIVETDKPNG